MLTRLDPEMSEEAARASAPHAVVIGAGLGGLASAMRLGARGYRVSVMDRLDSPGGRGSSLMRDGHRFDLGPTIVTVPQIFRELWSACGRDFDADVDLRALECGRAPAPFCVVLADALNRALPHGTGAPPGYPVAGITPHRQGV